MLPKGTRVVLRSDRTQPLKDRYDRLLRHMAKHGKKDVGAVQLRKGNAKVYVVGKRFTKLRTYKKAVSSAKDDDRGMWSHC
jgi:endonuclease YncB( thermonuclease family)